MDQSEPEMSAEGKTKAKEVMAAAKSAVEKLLKEAEGLATKVTNKKDDLFQQLKLCNACGLLNLFPDSSCHM